MPQAQPYPQRVMGGAAPGSFLNADEAFALLEALPDGERFEESPEDAIVEFQRWLNANPELARRPPADRAIRTLGYRAETVLMKRLTPEIAGTYRFTVARPEGDSAVFFARTYPRPTTAWPREAAVPAPTLNNLRAPRSYYVLTAFAPSEGELPTGNADRRMDREGYLAMEHEARRRPDGDREWIARLEGRYLDQMAFAGRTEVARTDASASQGAFVMGRDGHIRVELVVGSINGVPIAVRGHRISSVKIDSSW